MWLDNSNLVCECGEELDVILTANVTNETGEDSLQIFGWQYWVSSRQIMSNCLYL